MNHQRNHNLRLPVFFFKFLQVFYYTCNDFLVHVTFGGSLTSGSHEHCIMHHLSAMTWALTDFFIAFRQLIFTDLHMGPSRVQVQLLQGDTRLL